MAKTYNGGYVMLDLADPKLYDRAKAAIGSGKPVMLYDTGNAVYYIDSIALDGTNVVITKGGKTITITDANSVIASGEIQNHLYIHNASYINIQGDEMDIQGNLYFLYNEDLTDMLENLNNTSGETAFNNIKALLDKVIFINISNGADGGASGYAEKNLDGTYQYGTEGASESLTASSVDLAILCQHITVKQLF